MADEKTKSTPSPATVKPAAESKDNEKDLSPQEIEAKKEADELKATEERQKNITELIKSKKYFLPIK